VCMQDFGGPVGMRLGRHPDWIADLIIQNTPSPWRIGKPMRALAACRRAESNGTAPASLEPRRPHAPGPEAAIRERAASHAS
jgi:hypothetical protein